MKSTVGRPVKTTRAQIESVLEWHRYRRTIEDWARIFGVSRNTISYALKRWTGPEEWSSAGTRRGRRRALGVSEMQTLIAWHRTRRTRAQLARELGLAKGQVGHVIMRRGRYKRCTQEEHEAMKAARLRKLERLEVPSATVDRFRDAWRRLRAQNAARCGLARVASE
jgi:hypothetical protein